MAASHKLMDATVPRPAPRFPFLPTPFNFEKPSAQVPDISLIFDSTTSGPQHNSTPVSSNSIPAANDSGGKQPNSFEFQVLYDILKKQEEVISRMGSQMQLIIDYQEIFLNKYQDMLVQTSTKPSSIKTTDVGTQTDKVEDTRVEDARVEDTRVEDTRVEDVSTILKDLQLPTIQEASLFSEASVQPLDLQDYNDSMEGSDLERIGPSVSAYGSSDDEEIIQPTATFYRNVIGNVNRMLENQQPTLYGASDTTVYGMSSSNLSFATKQYLQKYGLVKPKKFKDKHVSPEANRVFANDERPQHNNNRVLDLTALKNQPKLL